MDKKCNSFSFKRHIGAQEAAVINKLTAPLGLLDLLSKILVHELLFPQGEIPCLSDAQLQCPSTIRVCLSGSKCCFALLFFPKTVTCR